MKARKSSLLIAYRIATTALAPLAPLLLRVRLRRGKEDGLRMSEKLGRASLARPTGSLAWLHGASVGESLALLPVVERLTERGWRVLVTTGTKSSADILKARLPSGTAHQYAPLDAPQFVRRFLDHWRPDLVLIAESELWPNLLHAVHARSTPLVLINARLSQRSHDRWRKFPHLIAAMLGRIDLCLAQTREDGARLLRLGAPRVQVSGNLKYDAPALPVDSNELAALRAAIGARPVWLAASTHPREEAIVADVHAQLVQSMPNILTIIAPRHAARGPSIADVAERSGITPTSRSAGASIDAATKFYVADTMGELGLFYRLANVVFIGKSLGGETGGQNPIEPAKLGVAVLHGNDVRNFDEVYTALEAARASISVADGVALAETLQHLLSNTAELRRMAQSAAETVSKFEGATNAIIEALEPYLTPAKMDVR